MIRKSVCKNGEKNGPNKSVHGDNVRYPKPNPKTGWAAGGHAPQGKPSPALVKWIKERIKKDR